MKNTAMRWWLKAAMWTVLAVPAFAATPGRPPYFRFTPTGGGGTGGPPATAWVQATDPFPGGPAADSAKLVIRPTGEIYCGRSSGLAMSTDQGNSWTTISGPLPYQDIRSLFLTVQGDLLAGVGLGQNDGAWRLSGGIWNRCNKNIVASNYVSNFAFDQTGAIIAVTANDGDVWRSTTAGASFFKVATHVGGTPAAQAGWLRPTAVDPATGILYTGGEIDGLYSSPDNGSTWTLFGLDIANGYKDNMLVMLFNGLGELVVGRDHSGGSSIQRYSGGQWVHSSNGIPNFASVSDVVMGKNPGTLYAAYRPTVGLPAPSAVYISHDDGATWGPFLPGLSGVTPMKLAMGPDGTLYAILKDGTFYRTNGVVP